MKAGKTIKAVAKRFKITGRGKILRRHGSSRHLMSSKSGKRKRHIAKANLVDAANYYHIATMLRNKS